MQHRTSVLTAGLLIAAAPLARADEPAAAPEPAAAAPAPSQQLAIPKGGIVIDGFFTANLSSNAAFKPVSLSPDIWYGATDDLTVGLVHSSEGSLGFIGGVGTSLCLGSTSSGCAGVYNNVGADVRYRLTTPFSIDGGLFLFNLANSAQFTIKLGASGRWRFDKIVLEVQPSLLVYLTNRADGGTVMMVTTQPATETLSIPVTAAYRVMPELELGLQTGLSLPFSNTGDFYAVPLSIFGRYRVMPKLSLGLAFTFLELIGKTGGADARSLTLGGSYAL
jgi:hypothetical protein